MFKSTGNDAFCKPNKKKFVFQEDVKSIYVLYSQSVYLQQILFFVGDYLTTAGQEPTADWGMIADLGFEIEECAL